MINTAIPDSGDTMPQMISLIPIQVFTLVEATHFSLVEGVGDGPVIGAGVQLISDTTDNAMIYTIDITQDEALSGTERMILAKTKRMM